MVQNAQSVARFITELPYCKALGLTLVKVEAGMAELALPYARGLVGDPQTGVMHGGAVSALMDTTCGAAVVSHDATGLSTATLDMRVVYLRVARPGRTITARAECHRVTRFVAFVRAIAWDEDPNDPVAEVNGTYTVDAVDVPARQDDQDGRA
ncbi:MAG: PaaI family thioesterase [Pseudomonadota bacterium]